MAEKLFVYGTLKDPEVQKRVFGRTTEGIPDALEGYEKSQLVIEGETFPALVPKEGSIVDGLVLEVNPDELAKIDEYETAAYVREKVNLKSGAETWVYLKN